MYRQASYKLEADKILKYVFINISTLRGGFDRRRLLYAFSLPTGQYLACIDRRSGSIGVIDFEQRTIYRHY